MISDKVYREKNIIYSSAEVSMCQFKAEALSGLVFHIPFIL
jgi:hypothetical protein